ncbi:PREDICTED: E3 ubiquitin-protein ligase UBR4-like [Amphimedon queenslandica]|uniref:Uncharacterized protein n=1 Tax=Amphimedon queenslandica TaxID=400682 RepID=A0AAN0JIA7_AMPQE|nr:PREDICTED: E3 ubiquitin-protein ligase UBR4-like [Amphimedon queenslandica]|eukprot:XP_019856393.1 PREDICTED: E3 ubiquitin-protein ligase UBR4-like [Amphimedon queenslandica]
MAVNYLKLFWNIQEIMIKLLRTEYCDKILSKYQDELLPAESFEEYCDVMGLLNVIQSPSTFLKDVLSSVTVSSS